MLRNTDLNSCKARLVSPLADSVRLVSTSICKPERWYIFIHQLYLPKYVSLTNITNVAHDVGCASTIFSGITAFSTKCSAMFEADHGSQAGRGCMFRSAKRSKRAIPEAKKYIRKTLCLFVFAPYIGHFDT